MTMLTPPNTPPSSTPSGAPPLTRSVTPLSSTMPITPANSPPPTLSPTSTMSSVTSVSSATPMLSTPSIVSTDSEIALTERPPHEIVSRGSLQNLTFKKFKKSGAAVYGLVEVVAGIAEPFVPYLQQAFTVCQVIARTMDQLQYLRDSCSVLARRIEESNEMISEVARQFYAEPGKFENDGFTNAFERYISMLIEVQAYIIKISNKTTLSKIIRVSDYQRHFDKIQRGLDDSVHNLAIAISFCINGKIDVINDKVGNIVAMVHHTNSELDKTREQFVNEIADFRSHFDSGLEKISQDLKSVLVFMKEKDQLESKESRVAADHLVSDAMIDGSQVKNLEFNEDPYSANIKMYRGSMVEKEIHVRPRKQEVIDIKREVGLMRSVSNCRFVRHCYGMYEHGNQLVVLHEYAEKGLLSDLMAESDTKISWKERWNMSFDICQGICFLHACEIFHHDVRAANVVVTDRMQAKLSNFSVSRLQSAQSVSRKGDQTDYLRWVAPEKSVKDPGPFTVACEIYSFGMLLWEIAECSGNSPFSEISSGLQVAEYVQHGDLHRPPIALNVPPAFQEIITIAWKHNPELRPTADELSQKLMAARFEIQSYNDDSSPREKETFEDFDAWSYSLPDEDVESEVVKLARDAKVLFEKLRFNEAWGILEPLVKEGEENEKNAMALFYAAKILENGLGQAKDQGRADRFYQLSAEMGYPDAQFIYAMSLARMGKHPAAFSYFLKAAEEEYGPAMKVLADVYSNGKLGQRRDTFKAREWKDKIRWISSSQ